MIESLRIDQLLRRALHEGVAPAVALGVLHRGQRKTWYGGVLHPGANAPAAGAGTCFDLASLTKPITTLTWCLRLVEAGLLELDAPIGELAPVKQPALRSAPLHQLLSHTSGLPAHREYFRGLAGAALAGRHPQVRSAVRRMLARGELEAAPGAQERYSDLGFLLLEWICERADRPLTEVWPSLPLHGEELLFSPDDATRCAATERCPWRGRLLQGEVHDDNCWAMGGVAGHAGLFGTLDGVLAFVAALFETQAGASPLGISPELFAETIDRRHMHPRGTRVLGWDTPTPGASSAGRFIGRGAIGHLGFTGTSMWIDFEAELGVVLLTNRVCPSRHNEGIRWFRPAIHEAVWGALG